MEKIIITVLGGNVQNVFSTNTEIEVVVVDYDNEPDSEEVTESEEMKIIY